MFGEKEKNNEQEIKFKENGLEKLKAKMTKTEETKNEEVSKYFRVLKKLTKEITNQKFIYVETDFPLTVSNSHSDEFVLEILDRKEYKDEYLLELYENEEKSICVIAKALSERLHYTDINERPEVHLNLPRRLFDLLDIKSTGGEISCVPDAYFRIIGISATCGDVKGRFDCQYLDIDSISGDVRCNTSVGLANTLPEDICINTVKGSISGEIFASNVELTSIGSGIDITIPTFGKIDVTAQTVNQEIMINCSGYELGNFDVKTIEGIVKKSKYKRKSRKPEINLKCRSIYGSIIVK